jgi:hypothetical protein
MALGGRLTTICESTSHATPAETKGAPVRHFRAIPFVIATAAVTAIVAGTALAATQSKVAFKGTYKGTVAEKVDGSNVTAVATATGKGSVVGSSKLAGTVTATTANPPCSPLLGPGTITGPKGKLKINVVTGSRGCAAGEDDQDNISISGTAKVTGGTGALKRAKGSLHFSGHYDRTAHSFNVTLTGSLTY